MIHNYTLFRIRALSDDSWFSSAAIRCFSSTKSTTWFGILNKATLMYTSRLPGTALILNRVYIIMSKCPEYTHNIIPTKNH